MSESMNTAIKTISLDDIGDVQARSPKVVGKNANMLYRPTYKTDPSSVELAEQTGTQGGTLTNFRALTDQRSPSSIGIALTNMTRLFGGKMSMQGPMGLLLGIGGVLFSGVLIFLWLQSTEMSSPLERLRDFVAPLFGENLPTAPRVEATSAQIINEVSLEATVSPNPAANPEGLENPYWNIPNPLKLDENLGASGNLSQSQEERWRQGLAHPFTWQRFKTVREMRQAKLKGSQNLLNDALAQPKFWTRMEAVLGLAELGEEVDIDSVETALGHARSTLIQNYFLRFRHRFNGGELYIMRQAVRLADAGTRLVILQNLMQDRSADNELYLVAATLDPDQGIKNWIQQELRARPIGHEVLEKYKIIAANSDEVPTPAASPNPHAQVASPGQISGQAEAKSKTDDIKVEQLSDKVNVEDVYFINNEEKSVAPKVDAAPPPDDGFQQLEKR